VSQVGLWEPGEGRPSRRVLREPGGAIPPGHSPDALVGGSFKGEIAAAILVALYAIPGYMFYYMAVLNRECRRLLMDGEAAKASEPHLNEQTVPGTPVGCAPDLGIAGAGETTSAASEEGIA
jgi:hypothetical protein